MSIRRMLSAVRELQYAGEITKGRVNKHNRRVEKRQKEMEKEKK